jgi:glycine/D-amino acid oxidase-like deaminating enzyme
VSRSAIVIGAGIFGVTGALALRARGFDVTLIDRGPLPHPLAESTDISKVVRLDYGADDDYTAWMEAALPRWREWNARFGETLFHETGLAFLCRAKMARGGFEHDSYETLRRRGYAPERLDSVEIRRRFPAWNADRFVDGYFNPVGGYAESGRVVGRLLQDARAAGIAMREDAHVAALDQANGAVRGVRLEDGTALFADRVVLAAGSWSHHLVPQLAMHLRSVGQPVFHLAPHDGCALFESTRFPVFGADIARTGYYGFPITQSGVVKIANHGVGRPMHPESSARAVTSAEVESFREFLLDTFPALASAPLAASRVCVYGDTLDEHFLIAPVPNLDGLVVAAGGSGHGFKFAPMLGDFIADAVDGNVIPKFRWRPELAAALASRGEEASRHHA